MGILDLFRGRRGREVTVIMRSAMADRVLGMSVEEVYATQPELRAVVSFIADNIAQLPLKCYVRESDTSRVRDTEGVLPLLLASPGGGVTTFELVRDSVSDFKLYGWFLWVVMRDADSPSGWQLRRIPPPWVDSTPTVDGFAPAGYWVKNPDTDGRRVRLPAEACIRFTTYNPAHPTMPLSPVESLKLVIAERASSREYRHKVWLNGGWFSRYIKRPRDAPDWSQGGENSAKARFARDWKSRFAGKEGTDTGGMPILEDGMELVDSTLNAKEAEWAESMRLTREDVAAAYHLNPAQVWSNDGQTYASVRENARSLYVDTLGPDLEMICQRINMELAAMVGADPRSYCEFDLGAKLAGSFEEQAAVLSQSVGGPWMLRNEARARQNLPAVDGGDELIVPMNVVEGGLASPHDTDPTQEYAGAFLALARAVEARGAGSGKDEQPPRKSRGDPTQEDSAEVATVLRRFLRRQRKKVLPAIDSAKDRGLDVKALYPSWWDAKRWNRELAADLAPVFQSQAVAAGRRSLVDLECDPEDFDAGRIEAYIRKMAEGRAKSFNQSTLRQLRAALAGELGDDAEGSTPEGVFDKQEDAGADRDGLAFATGVSCWALSEAIRQEQPRGRITKTWVVNSSNPRSSHLAMSGETVPYSEPFSNGAMFPHDRDLEEDERCGCQCSVEVTIY